VKRPAELRNNSTGLTQAKGGITMAQATNSLSQSTFQPISASAVHMLARLAAKKAVKEQMRAEGRRMTLVLPAEINAKANEYLALDRCLR
jgi:hypothetical protein